MQSSLIRSFLFHVSIVLRLTATCSVSSAFPVVRSDDHDRRVFLNCFFHESLMYHNTPLRFMSFSPTAPAFSLFGTTCNCPVLTRRAARHKVFVNTERTKPKACSSVFIALHFSLFVCVLLSHLPVLSTRTRAAFSPSFYAFSRGRV